MTKKTDPCVSETQLETPVAWNSADPDNTKTKVRYTASVSAEDVEVLTPQQGTICAAGFCLSTDESTVTRVAARVYNHGWHRNKVGPDGEALDGSEEFPDTDPDVVCVEPERDLIVTTSRKWVFLFTGDNEIKGAVGKPEHRPPYTAQRLFVWAECDGTEWHLIEDRQIGGVRSTMTECD